jgi:hypothetical protein
VVKCTWQVKEVKIHQLTAPVMGYISPQRRVELLLHPQFQDCKVPFSEEVSKRKIATELMLMAILILPAFYLVCTDSAAWGVVIDF